MTSIVSGSLQAYSTVTTKKALRIEEEDELEPETVPGDTLDLPNQTLYIDESPEYESESDENVDDKLIDDIYESESDKDEDDELTVEAEVNDGQYPRFGTMNNNFVTRSGRKVAAPNKFMHD